jgi:phosphatidylcholine synthase
MMVFVHPDKPLWLMVLWFASGIYFVGVCVWRTAREWLA